MGKIDLKGKDWDVELIDYSEPDTRPKRFYYRPCGMKVGPWPYDKKSQREYLRRGFLLEPPKGSPLPQKTFRCQVCGKEHDNLSDLIDCLNSHKEVKDGIP